MKKHIFLLCLCCFSVKLSAQPDTLRLALASDLLMPVREICRVFTEKHHSYLDITSGSVGVLSEQIRQKSPFDLLISADRRFHKMLAEEGFMSLKTKDFARSPIVLWTKIKNGAKSPAVCLKDERIRKIYVPADKLSLFGLRVHSYLNKSEFTAAVIQKIVNVESLAKVNSMIFVEEADAAFASVSAMHSNTLKNKGLWTVIPGKKYSVPLTAGITRIGNRLKSASARKFIEFLEGPEARKILLTHGYLTD